MRPGIERLVSQLASLPGVSEVTLTTNGAHLPRMAEALKSAGLKRVNISLDSLDTQRFADITRGGKLDRTLAGIRAAEEAQLFPIKINTVLMRSSWKKDVPLLLDYAARSGHEVRFIELMRTGTERVWCEAEFIAAHDICRELGLNPSNLSGSSSGPACTGTVSWRGAALNVGWITPRSQPFCSTCTRLRMDAKGRLRRCLMDMATLDLPSLLSWCGDRETAEALHSYLAGKVPPQSMDNPLAMSQIGG